MTANGFISRIQWSKSEIDPRITVYDTNGLVQILRGRPAEVFTRVIAAGFRAAEEARQAELDEIVQKTAEIE